jgi:ABC-type sugar transport system permease subunit
MTNGGPAGATSLVGLLVFQHATQLGGTDTGLGMGSAMGWTLFVFTFILAMLNLRLFRART